MRINRYECDLCGSPIENGREYKVTIKYPMADDKMPNRVTRQERKTKTFDLCKQCFLDLPEIIGEYE